MIVDDHDHSKKPHKRCALANRVQHSTECEEDGTLRVDNTRSTSDMMSTPWRTAHRVATWLRRSVHSAHPVAAVVGVRVVIVRVSRVAAALVVAWWVTIGCEGAKRRRGAGVESLRLSSPPLCSLLAVA